MADRPGNRQPSRVADSNRDRALAGEATRSRGETGLNRLGQTLSAASSLQTRCKYRVPGQDLLRCIAIAHSPLLLLSILLFSSHCPAELVGAVSIVTRSKSIDRRLHLLFFFFLSSDQVFLAFPPSSLSITNTHKHKRRLFHKQTHTRIVFGIYA
jgi:hypothetical protein